MMITLTNAYHKAGYTRIDHQLDDSPVQALVGRQFRSVGEAKRAVTSASMKSGNSANRQAPIGIEVMFADQSKRSF